MSFLTNLFGIPKGGVPAVSNWYPYVMTVRGSGTNPTKGSTIAIDSAWWRRVGDSIEIKYTYRHTAAGSGGSGVYLYSLPPIGVTADLRKQDIANGPSSTWLNVIGSAEVGQSGWGITYLYNATSIAVAFGDATNNLTALGSASFSYGNPTVEVAFRATIPIREWDLS